MSNMTRMLTRSGIVFLLLLSCQHTSAQQANARPTPGLPASFLQKHCLSCHEGKEAALEVRIDRLLSDERLDAVEREHLLERVLKAIKDKQMPPAESDQPALAERTETIGQLDAYLLATSKPRALMRRLTATEYQNTIRHVLGYNFVLPEGFPADSIQSQFRNTSAEMRMSAPLMEAYYHTATEIADHVFPPPPPPVKPKTTSVKPDDLVISYSSGLVLDGVLRLAARTDTMWRSSTWPERFEAQRAGTFNFEITASAFAPGSAAILKFDGPMKMQLRARSLNSPDGDAATKQRLLAEFDVTGPAPQTFRCTADLYENETPVIYFANAVLSGDSGQKKSFADLLNSMFRNDPRLLAGWLSVEHGSGLRGGVGWDRVRKIRDSDELDLSSIDMSEKAVAALVRKMTGNPGLYAETVIYQLFEEGPALSIHELKITGPNKSIVSPADKQRSAQIAKVVGTRGELTSRSFANAAFARLLPKLFRRPVSDAERTAYVQLVEQESTAGADVTQGLHLALRSALMSPHFLYRESVPVLDDHALAARLSYFLTLSPPDTKLVSAAGQNRLLEDAGQLRKETSRLIASGRSREFINDFVAQWLQTDDLTDISPDPVQFPFFNEQFGNSINTEAQLLLLEVVRRNLPLNTLINPGFTFADAAVAKHIYGQDLGKKKGFQRIELKDDSPQGGLLGLPAVMLATSNGTDTQPVLRGVWVLSNILGDPPPEPPSAVPALTPDTRGTSTVREQLAAHRTNTSCAACHRKIDPAGMAFENLDALGRWRTHYPQTRKGDAPASIDASGSFPGPLQKTTKINDIRQLRELVLDDMQSFGNCFAGKLLTYAMGRPLTWAERKEIDRIVAANLDREQGVRDLILDLVNSQTFRTR